MRNALMDAPREIRDRIIVVAIAPAATITDDLCFKAFNYASKNDIVPKGEILYGAIVDCLVPLPFRHHMDDAYERQQENLVLLDPAPGAGCLDHDFQSPTFEPIIRGHMEDYLKRSGEY